MHVSGFFDAMPAGPEREPAPYVPPAWHQPPPDELPGRVALDAVLHRDDATVLWLRDLSVYDTGIAVALRWTRRRRDESADDWNRLIHGELWHGSSPREHGLLVGFELADGRRVFPADPSAWFGPDSRDPEPPTLSMLGGGGGGGEDRYSGDIDTWLWSPGGVRGDLELVLVWRALGIDELRYRVDGGLIAGASRPRLLWADAGGADDEVPDASYPPDGDDTAASA
ncbi:hypothetical protein [Agromyces silvae]|uniref:hypothetical protein n=1 Tax=Agromyces silvae TaxID=3388266 RepID=UPI00280ADEC5|nr:hypothetical protein [Agromyces protaetiae]